jgi:multidrug resistance efflux pump
MNRRSIGYGVSAVAAAGVVAGVAWLWLGRGHSEDPPGGKDAGKNVARVRVEVSRPEQGGVGRTVTRPCSVNSFDHADLYAQVSGYLKTQVVDIGDAVKRGQVLAEIDAPEVLAEERQASADLDKARAYVGVAQARVEGSEANLEQARNKVRQAEADLSRAQALVVLRKAEFRRVKTLAEQNAVEQELVDEKRAAQRAAESEGVSAEQAVATAKSGVRAAVAAVSQAGADLADARAQVKVAEAALTRARARAEFTRILSPYDGVVTRRNYHPGDFVRNAARGGETPLLQVARTDLMRVVTYVPDPDVPYARSGVRLLTKCSCRRLISEGQRRPGVAAFLLP